MRGIWYLEMFLLPEGEVSISRQDFYRLHHCILPHLSGSVPKGLLHQVCGNYKRLFSQGVEDCVAYSMKQCKTLGLTTISAEKATQWPRLLLYTQTLPSQYLATVTYDVAPAPAAFTTADGIRVNTRINYDTISTDSIYIIYYTEADLFKDSFTLTPFYDWYVAVPK